MRGQACWDDRDRVHNVFHAVRFMSLSNTETPTSAYTGYDRIIDCARGVVSIVKI